VVTPENAPTLAQIEQRSPDRNSAIAEARTTDPYSNNQIGDPFGIHVTMVGNVVRQFRRRL
jgi:hypothetical protein